MEPTEGREQLSLLSTCRRAADLHSNPPTELITVRLPDRGSRLDEEIRSRSHNGVLEGSSQRTRLEQVVYEGLPAERYALSVDRRLNHLFVLAELQCSHWIEAAEAQRTEPRPPIHERFHGARIIEIVPSGT